MRVFRASALLLCALLVAAAFAAAAEEPEPGIAGVMPGSDYASVDITFTVPVFGDVEDDDGDTSGTGDPDTDAFDVTGLPGGVSLDAVERVADDVLKLRFAEGDDPAAALPNATEITTVAGALYTADGEPIDPLSALLPFTPEDVARLVAGLADIEARLVELGEVPLAGSWLANLPDEELGEGEEFDPDDLPTRALAELVGVDVGDVLEEIEGALPTQEEVLDRLQDLAVDGLDLFDTIDFTTDGLDVAFAEGVRVRHAVEHEFEVEALGLEFDAAADLDVGLEGAVAVALPADGDGVIDPDATSLAFHADASVAATDLDARLGFADATLGDVTAAGSLEVSLAFDCGEEDDDPCMFVIERAGDGALDTDGGASVDLPSFSVTLGGEAFDFDPDDPVRLLWDLTDVPEPDFEEDELSLLPEVENLDLFEALGLPNFSNADFGDLASGLGFVAAWIANVDEHGLMDTELPLVGQSAGEIARLAEHLSDEVDALLEAAGDEPSAQDVAELLCAQGFVPDGVPCDEVLDFDPEDWELRYDVAVDLDLSLFPDGHTDLALALTSELDGIDVDVDAGDWSGSSATATVTFGLGVKLDGDDELEAALDDHDPDDAPEIEDPAIRDYTLAEGDLCRGLARFAGVSRDALLEANDVGLAGCDDLVETGETVVVDGEPDLTLDDGDVCTAAARVHNRTAATFRDLNGFADDAACAGAVAPGATFHWDPEMPVRLGHRVFLDPADELVSLSLTLDAQDLGADVRFGFLDLRLSGSALLEPELTVTIADPAWTLDDGYVDLVELAAAADAGRMPELVDVDLGGPATASFDLDNNLIDVGNPGLDVAGDLSSLVTAPRFDFSRDRIGDVDGAKDSTPIAVGLELGDWHELRDLSPAQVLRMLVDTLAGLGDLARSDVLDHEIPFTGVSLQDMAAFARRAARIAEQVENRDPQTLSGFESALRAALADAGLPSAVDVSLDELDDLALQFDFDLSYTRTDSYPFALSLDAFDNAAVPINPFDGGAQITATTSVAFEPTVGIVLAPGASLDDRVYVSGDPTISADITADVAGDAYLGPIGVSLDGIANAGPELMLALTGGDRLTLAELGQRARGQGVGGLLQWDGNLGANIDVSGVVSGNVTIAGTIADAIENPSSIDVVTDINFDDITIDLETLIRGTAQTARFIGHLLKRSEALAQGMPILGDELTRLTGAGDDLRAAADAIEDGWENAGRDAAAFLADLEGDLQDEICGPGSECIELMVDDGSGLQPVSDVDDIDLNDVEDLQVRLGIGDETTGSPQIDGGLDLAVLAFDLNTELEFTFGYEASLILGISRDDGFYVDAGDGNGGALLELYAQVDTEIEEATLRIAGIDAAAIVDGAVRLSGNGGDERAAFLLELDDRLSFAELADRRTPVDQIVTPRLSIDALLDLPVVVAHGISAAPSVTFPVLFTWGVDGDLTDLDLPSPDLWVGYPDGVHPEHGEERLVSIEAGEFVDGVIGPIVAQLAEFNPINADPIQETLNREIGLIELSLRDVLDFAAGDDPAWRVFTFFLDLSSLIDRLDEMDDEITIGLGHVHVLSSDPAVSTPDFVEGEDWQTIAEPLKDLIDTLSAMAGGPNSYNTNTTSAQSANLGAQSVGNPGQVVRVPLLDEPLQVLGLILGGDLQSDVTFIEIDPPPVRVGWGISWNQTLFDLDVVFLEASLEVGLEGHVGLTLRLGAGYSSRGLRTGNLFHGLYLIDPIEGNRRLPVVALGGHVGASVDGKFRVVGVASVKFRGAGRLRAEAGLNLYSDAPTVTVPDHRFHLDEILTVIDTHTLGTGTVLDGITGSDVLCMFRPSIGVSADLGFSGKAKVFGKTVWSGSFFTDFVPPLGDADENNPRPIFEASITCPTIPQPAKMVNGDLVLNAGPEAEDRFDGNPNAVEGFHVSMADASTVRVEWLGDDPAGSLDFATLEVPLEEVSEIRATLGNASGEGGTVIIDPDVPVPAHIVGSDHGDDITTGGGDDTIDAGSGDNTVRVVDGDNLVLVGNGQNTVTVAGGENVVDGGTGATTYVFEGEWGETDLFHAGDNAILDFGPAASRIHATSSYGFGEILARDGGDNSVLEYVVEDVGELRGSNVRVRSGDEESPEDYPVDDIIEIGSDAPDGLIVDGQEGDDHIIVDATALATREVLVTDTGPADDHDTLEVVGTFGADTYVFRARPNGDGITAPLDPLGQDDVDVTPDRDVKDPPAPPPAQLGVVALPGRIGASGEQAVERIRYDDRIDHLVVDGVGGENEFYLDDTATSLTIEGRDGANRYQVGQIFGRTLDNDDPAKGFNHYRFEEFGVAAGDEVRTRDVRERGPMSLGISHPATLRGGGDDDFFQVFSNTAELTLEGVSGDNTFVIRAFILEGSVRALGGDGNDFFEYVRNELVSIDGGDGFNTMVVIGTEGSDGFVLDDAIEPDDENDVGGFNVCPVITHQPFIDDEDGFLRPAVPSDAPVARLPYVDSDECGISVEYERIQRVVLVAGFGNNAFWIRSTSPEREFDLLGGRDGDTFLIGDGDVEFDYSSGGGSSGSWSGGDVTGIQGPVRVVGDGRAEEEFDLSVPDPVVLPGEDDTPSTEPSIPDFDVTDNTMVVNASAHTADDVGRLTDELADGLGMGEGGVYGPAGEQRELPGGVAYDGMHIVDVLLGTGDDAFTVEGTSTFQIPFASETASAAQLLSVAGDVTRTRTIVRGGGGDDDIAVQAVDGPTEVHGDTGTNTVRLGSAATTGIDAPDRTSTMATIADTLSVIGGDGDDTLLVDASGSEAGERVDLDVHAFDLDVANPFEDIVASYTGGLVTELSMPGQVEFAGVDLLDMSLTDHADVANARGVATHTILRGLDDDDRFFVSDAADYAGDAPTPAYLPGTLADIDADLDIQAGADDNLLMVSALDGEDAITGATLDADRLSGFADGEIRYDATGTFAGGITIWTGVHDDEIGVVGTRLDGDPTTLDWHADRAEGGLRTITTLNTGDGDDHVTVDVRDGDGLLVINLGDGDDELDGADSTLGFVVFGGPGNDTITTGDGDDIVFGDEGRVEYRADGEVVTELGDELVANVNDGVARRPDRIVTHLPVGWEPGEPDNEGFNNRIFVGGGDDVAFGGLGDARIDASSGRNALLGDHGQVWRLHDEEFEAVTVQTNDGFLDVTLRDGVPFVYDIDLFDGEGGGHDAITGGTDDDVIFGGPGNDVIVGSPGDGTEERERGDVIFAGDGDDIVWGGPGDDRIYGGNGENFVNVKQPTFDAGEITRLVHDEDWWAAAWAYAPEVDTNPSPDRPNGDNIVYGGRGRDVIQTDSGGGGPQPGDRLMNWYGTFNLFVTCEGAYGAGWVLRQPNPDVVDALIDLAEADGAVDVRDEGSAGWRQLALVTDEHRSENRNPPHPDHPGNNAFCG